jgi:hypothetical protein
METRCRGRPEGFAALSISYKDFFVRLFERDRHRDTAMLVLFFTTLLALDVTSTYPAAIVENKPSSRVVGQRLNAHGSPASY